MIIRLKDGSGWKTKDNSNIVFYPNEYKMSWLSESDEVITKPMKDVKQIEPI